MSVFIVLGMHKSGTTLVARMLHESGINMVDDVSSLTYDQGYKFERKSMQEINKTLISECLIPTMRHFFRPSFYPQHNAAGHTINDDAIALVRHKVLAKQLAKNPLGKQMNVCIAKLDQEFGEWGFKDPRTCLTYPAWDSSLPDHKIIVVFRHYNQLLQRYALSGLKQLNVPLVYRVLNAWVNHNDYILQVIKETTLPVSVFSYEQLMGNESALPKLGEFIGRPLVDTRDPQLYRNRTDEGMPVGIVPSSLYSIFSRHPQAIYNELLEYTQRNDVMTAKA